MKNVILIVSLFLMTGCSKRYVEEIKKAAPQTFEQAGFRIIGYEGYQYGSFDSFGGRVWYTLERKPSNGVTYHAAVTKWGDEFHIYALEAVDAIKAGK